MRGRGITLALCVATTVFLLAPAIARAVSRTWVSGVGSDLNPCTRTAPCQTWAGALGKTDVGGEIDALDPGDFGPVTITQSVTLSATGLTAGVQTPSAGNAITINAGSGVVTLKGLELSGDGVGTNGVEVDSAGAVHLEGDEIYGFSGDGVFLAPPATTTLYVDGAQIHDNTQDAVQVNSPPSGLAQAVITNSTLENNGCGLVASSLATAAFSPGNCGESSSGNSSGAATVTSSNTAISGSGGAGVLSAGPGATNYLTNDLIDGNTTGLQEVDGGQIIEIGANSVFGNASAGSPTQAVNTGPVGPAGSQGPAGPAGSNGKVELIKCRRVTVTRRKRVHGKVVRVKLTKEKCTGKIVSGIVRFRITGKAVHATLSRSGDVIATGTVVGTGSGRQGLLVVARRIPAGLYTMTAWSDPSAVARQLVRFS